MTNLKRGNVYLVNFDPTLGAEIRKTRPALVLQNDIADRHSPITIVASVTSHFGEKRALEELELRLKHDLTLRLGSMMVVAIGVVAMLMKLP